MEFNIRKYIYKVIQESFENNSNEIEFMDEEEMMDEERITNPDAKEYVARRENFIGSHIWGENLNDLGLMYVAYSYGEQYPAYLWYKNKWFHNTDNYLLDDGTVNEFTKKHMEDMRPTRDTHGISGRFMQTMIKKFMKKHGIENLDHVSVEPGQKN